MDARHRWGVDTRPTVRAGQGPQVCTLGWEPGGEARAPGPSELAVNAPRGWRRVQKSVPLGLGTLPAVSHG